MMLVTSIHADVKTEKKSSSSDSLSRWRQKVWKMYWNNVYHLTKNDKEYSVVTELACTVCGCFIRRVKRHSQSK